MIVIGSPPSSGGLTVIASDNTTHAITNAAETKITSATIPAGTIKAGGKLVIIATFATQTSAGDATPGLARIRVGTANTIADTQFGTDFVMGGTTTSNTANWPVTALATLTAGTDFNPAVTNYVGFYGRSSATVGINCNTYVILGNQ